MKTPNLFIVGSPKCGTTSLYYYLKQHPDVFMSEDKEPNYYSSDINVANRISRESYFNLFKDANAKYIGESTPFYLFSKDAHKNIKKDSPNAKIILSLRKPSEFLFSFFHQNKYDLLDEASSFEEALEIEDYRKSNLNKTPSNKPVERLYYSDFLKFKDQINRYYDSFGKENVHVVIFDDLKKDTENSVRDIFKFLNIDDKVNIDFSIKNTLRAHKNTFIAKTVLTPSSFTRKIVRLFFNKKARHWIHSKTKEINTVSPSKAKKPKINEETRKILTQKYIPEVEALEKLLNKDLSNWKV